jgi:hypothetical protein
MTTSLGARNGSSRQLHCKVAIEVSPFLRVYLNASLRICTLRLVLGSFASYLHASVRSYTLRCVDTRFALCLHELPLSPFRGGPRTRIFG